MNDIQERINKTMDDFVNWLNDHDGSDICKPEEECDKLKPAVLNILMDAEKDFFAALEKLQEKHSSLTTIEDIVKLTKDVLKLCK